MMIVIYMHKALRKHNANFWNRFEIESTKYVDQAQDIVSGSHLHVVNIV